MFRRALNAYALKRMPARHDLLFGQIAIQLGFCSNEQVEAGLALQANAGRPMSLGRHLVEEGYLSEDQHSKVLEQQRRNLMKVKPAPAAPTAAPAAAAPKGEILFGRLVVREGFASAEDVNAALREQGRPGDRRTLGEVLVARGVLTPAQVEALLRKQQKWILKCPRCGVSLTVYSTSPTPKQAACPRCGSPLVPGGVQGESTSTLGEVDTRTLREAALRRPAPPVACRICGHAKLSKEGPDGRVECLSCHVRFVP